MDPLYNKDREFLFMLVISDDRLLTVTSPLGVTGAARHLGEGAGPFFAKMGVKNRLSGIATKSRARHWQNIQNTGQDKV